jgi:SulP family sulfate permease
MYIIIRLRNVPAIDSTGLNVFKDLVRRTRHDGTLVLLSDVHAQPMVALGRSALLDELGEDNVFGDIDAALARAAAYVGAPNAS